MCIQSCTVVEVGFEQERYTVGENDSIEVCIKVKEGLVTLGKDVVIQVAQQNGSAIGNTRNPEDSLSFG